MKDAITVIEIEGRNTYQTYVICINIMKRERTQCDWDTLGDLIHRQKL